jgi:hypothetical protein
MVIEGAASNLRLFPAVSMIPVHSVRQTFVVVKAGCNLPLVSTAVSLLVKNVKLDDLEAIVHACYEEVVFPRMVRVPLHAPCAASHVCLT